MVSRMTIPVRIGDCELYLGDCREILPGLGKVDAVVTDPPYGLGDLWQGGGNPKSKNWKFNPSEAMAWDQEAPEFVSSLPMMASQCVIWGGNFFNLPPARGWLVWNKARGLTIGDCELAWTNINQPIRAFNYSRANCLNEESRRKEHPAEKPIELMKWCFNFIPSGETILDPFMGSGTTGVACAKLGRKFVGIEIESRYFKMACRRIEAAYAQPDLFLAPFPKTEQKVML
jgi:DNA modification methylase